MYFHFRMLSKDLQFMHTGFAAVAVPGRKIFWSLLAGSASFSTSSHMLVSTALESVM